MKYLDLTQLFSDNMPVYPGDPLPELIKVADISSQGFVDHKIISTMHVGTHIDAPAHIMEGGKYLSDYQVEKFFGEGVLIDARGKALADADLLSNINIKPESFVLVMFGWSQKFGSDAYYQKYPELTETFARRLVDFKVSAVGMDTPGPDRPPFKVHKILLSHDILIIENLTNLAALINQKNFEITALPAKFKTEAATCRVVAKLP